MNAILVVVGVGALPFIKSSMGNMNKTAILKDMPIGQWLTLWEIAKKCNSTEFLVRKALMKLKKKGYVWEDNGLYMRR